MIRSILEPGNLLVLSTSNIVAYVLGGGTIRVDIGRVSIRLRRPRRRG
jgi:hypothetical protein